VVPSIETPFLVSGLKLQREIDSIALLSRESIPEDFLIELVAIDPSDRITNSKSTTRLKLGSSLFLYVGD
jgi:hypothetical protein